MKKSLCLFLSILILFSSLGIPSYAAEGKDLTAHFYSDLAGLDISDCRQFVDISHGKMTLCEDKVMIADYAQDAYFGEMKPGRTYYIYYEFDLTGCETPEELSSGTTSLTCDKGASLEWYYYVNTPAKTVNLYICEKIMIPGTFLQAQFGRILDFFLRLSAWSLY